MWSQRDKKSKPCTQDPALPVTRSASKIFIQMKIIYSVLASSKVYMNLSSLIFFTAKINGGFSWYTSEFYFHLVYYFQDTCCRSISLMKCTAHLACLRVLFQCHRDKPCTAALTRLALHRLCWVENVIHSGSKPHGHCCDLRASPVWQEVAVDRGQVEAVLDNTWTPAHKQSLFSKEGKRIMSFQYCSHRWMFPCWCNCLNHSYFVST